MFNQTKLSKKDQQYSKYLANAIQNLKEKRVNASPNSLKERIAIEDAILSISKVMKKHGRLNTLSAMTWLITNVFNRARVDVDDLHELYISKIELLIEGEKDDVLEE